MPPQRSRVRTFVEGQASAFGRIAPPERGSGVRIANLLGRNAETYGIVEELAQGLNAIDALKQIREFSKSDNVHCSGCVQSNLHDPHPVLARFALACELCRPVQLDLLFLAAAEVGENRRQADPK